MTDLDFTPDGIVVAHPPDLEEDDSGPEDEDVDEEEDVEKHWFPERIDTVVLRLGGYYSRPAPQPDPPPEPNSPLSEFGRNILMFLIITWSVALLTLSAGLIGTVLLRKNATISSTSTANLTITDTRSSTPTDLFASAESKSIASALPYNTSQPVPNFPVKIRKPRSVEKVSLKSIPTDRTDFCSALTAEATLNQNGHTTGNEQPNCTLLGIKDPSVCKLICPALEDLYGSFHPELAMSLLPALGSVSDKVRWNKIILENRIANRSVGVNAIPIKPPGPPDDLITPCFTNLAEEGPKHRYTVIPYSENTHITVRLTTCEVLDCGNHKHSEFHRGQAAYLCLYDNCNMEMGFCIL